jgi:hypothetical protein
MTPGQVRPYLANIHLDTERRPISEQVIDQVLAEDKSRYDLYNTIRGVADHSASTDGVASAAEHEAIGQFIMAWVDFEKAVHFRVSSLPVATPSPSGATSAMIHVLAKYGILDAKTQGEVDRIRRLRNSVVHGVAAADPADLRDATARLRTFTDALTKGS